MIIDVKQYLFIGVKEDLDIFFERAQKKGFIEFLSNKEKRVADYPDSLQKIIQSLRILSKQPISDQKKPTDNLELNDVNIDQISQMIIEKNNSIERLLEKKRVLKAEIDRVSPLGEFSIADVRNFEKSSDWNIQFFCVKESKLKNESLPKELIYISTEYDMKYFMSVSKNVESYPNMIEMHVEKSLEQLIQELDDVDKSLNQLTHELKEDVFYTELLNKHLFLQYNNFNFNFSKNEVSNHLNNQLFSIEGWIPKNRLHDLFPLLKGLGIHAEEVEMEKEKSIPTYMENKGFGKVGEQLVHIYDTPARSDKDPSTSVFWAFSIFFAMIISDAGYGVIFLILAFFLKKKLKKPSESLRLFLRLFKVLSVACIAWGVLANSYFGIDLSPKNPLQKLSIIQFLTVKKADYHMDNKDVTYKEVAIKFPQVRGTKNGEDFLEKATQIKGGITRYTVMDEFRDSIFMEIALIVGVLHISFSLLRYFSRSTAGVGWVIAIVGGYLFFPKVLHSTSIIHFLNLIPKQSGYIIGQQLLTGGIIIAIILAVIQHKWSGLIELAKPIELFADVLSYLRIYALGLAAMILANTFNEIGMNLGYVAGFCVILVGHAINIVVGIMGGTIHGLRLNFIEWYHHSFEGGGKMFDPLKLLKYKGD